MTSGVYPRKPGAKAGRKPMFTSTRVKIIKEAHAKGGGTIFLSAKFGASEKTIRHVITGTGAYKGM